jgi:hypothetical protein
MKTVALKCHKRFEILTKSNHQLINQKGKMLIANRKSLKSYQLIENLKTLRNYKKYMKVL